jgi:hypothetical protein
MRLLNEDHLNIDDNVGAENAMEACMAQISDILLSPRLEDETLSEEEAHVMTLIGGVLHTIAKKAQAYEDVYEKGILPENSQN